MDKIFTLNEQQFIHSKEAEKEQWIWMIWSMKESAYKSYYKQFKKRYFAPKMFDCYINVHQEGDDKDCILGTVKTLFQDYCTQSYILEDCIHTVAFVNERQVIHDYCFPLETEEYAVQANSVRLQLCSELASLEGCGVEDVQIRKDIRGIPYAYIGGEKAAFDISLSHHGTFGAYAISHELD